MKNQHGFINDSDLRWGIATFAVLCALGGAAAVFVIDVAWSWLRPMIHAWTG